MKKIHIVRLTVEERATCLSVVKKLKGSSEKVRRANILLKADADGPHWHDRQIADAFLCTIQSVQNVRERKTKIDWVYEVKVIFVCDNLNTHSIGAFYEAFESDVARSLVKRLEFVLTPKQGNWLNVSENELSALTVQCVKHRRFGIIIHQPGSGIEPKYIGNGIKIVLCVPFA